jgi:hypothetical protein
MRLTRALASFLCIGPKARARAMVSRTNATMPELEKTRRENILGFWQPRTLSRLYGGYVIDFGSGGEPNGKTSKGVVT